MAQLQDSTAAASSGGAEQSQQSVSLALALLPSDQRRSEDVIESAAVEERFMNLPLLKLRINPDNMPAILTVLSRARHTIDGKQYLMDHSEGFSVLEQSLTRYGTRIRILHDDKMYRNSSCTQENDRLRGLAEVAMTVEGGSRLQFRTYKPADGGFRCQHSKTWIVDDSYYIGGSANFTGASEGNFEENLFTRSKEVLADAKVAFEAAWQKGTEIPLRDLLALQSRRTPSRSKSRSRAADASAGADGASPSAA